MWLSAHNSAALFMFHDYTLHRYIRVEGRETHAFVSYLTNHFLCPSLQSTDARSCVIFPCALGCLFILLIRSAKVILCPRCLLLSQTEEDFSHSLRGRSNTCKMQERCQCSNGFKSLLHAELCFTPATRLTTMRQRNVGFNQQTKSWPICKHGDWAGRGGKGKIWRDLLHGFLPAFYLLPLSKILSRIPVTIFHTQYSKILSQSEGGKG